MPTPVRLSAILLALSLAIPACAEDAASKASPAGETTNVTANVAAPLPQATPQATPKAKSQSSGSSRDENTPAVEVFAGYDFTRINPPGPKFNSHGGIGSITGNINKWFGLSAEMSGVKPSDTPAGTDATAYTYLFGPQFNGRSDHLNTFVHFLFGAARLNADVSGAPTTGFLGATTHENAFAMALGGGFDAKLAKHFAWRIVQADYLMTAFKDGHNDRQHNFRAGTGLVFRFGGGPPPPPPNHPPVVSLTANPNKLFAGSTDTAVIQAQASDPDNDPLTYTWTSTCGKVDGTGAEVRFSAGDAAPGKCTVTSKVDDGRGGTASASTDVTVETRPNRPPTVTCSGAPATVTAGQAVAITATGSDPDNDQLTFTFDAPSGKVSGSGNTAQFDTTGLAPGHYTVNCHANDGKGGTADGRAEVDVRAPEPTKEQKQLEMRLSLH
ncbi:MAG TPA: hypothetical protein VFI72_11260, partial [Candidatus Angelobacter sp.]|nr:hypothetical protein [Candidatus Angelobacter sp.]